MKSTGFIFYLLGVVTLACSLTLFTSSEVDAQGVDYGYMAAQSECYQQERECMRDCDIQSTSCLNACNAQHLRCRERADEQFLSSDSQPGTVSPK